MTSATSIRSRPTPTPRNRGAGRKVELRYVKGDTLIPWQIIDEASGIYLAGFATRESAERYIERHGWIASLRSQ